MLANLHDLFRPPFWKRLEVGRFLLWQKIRLTILDIISIVWWQFGHCARCDKKIKGGFPRGDGIICAKCVIDEVNSPWQAQAR